jgi:hypothetical protein
LIIRQNVKPQSRATDSPNYFHRTHTGFYWLSFLPSGKNKGVKY